MRQQRRHSVIFPSDVEIGFNGFFGFFKLGTWIYMVKILLDHAGQSFMMISVAHPQC